MYPLLGMYRACTDHVSAMYWACTGTPSETYTSPADWQQTCGCPWASWAAHGSLTSDWLLYVSPPGRCPLVVKYTNRSVWNQNIQNVNNVHLLGRISHVFSYYIYTSILNSHHQCCVSKYFYNNISFNPLTFQSAIDGQLIRHCGVLASSKKWSTYFYDTPAVLLPVCR